MVPIVGNLTPRGLSQLLYSPPLGIGYPAPIDPLAVAAEEIPGAVVDLEFFRERNKNSHDRLVTLSQISGHNSNVIIHWLHSRKENESIICVNTNGGAIENGLFPIFKRGENVYLTTTVKIG